MPKELFSYNDQQLLKKLIVEFDQDHIVDCALRDAQTKQKKDDVWKKITDGFNSNSARLFDASTRQLRDLYTRLKFQSRNAKDEERKVADRKFRKDCAVTGGGRNSVNQIDDAVENEEDDTELPVYADSVNIVDVEVIQEAESIGETEKSKGVDRQFEERISNKRPLSVPFGDILSQADSQPVKKQKGVGPTSTQTRSSESGIPRFKGLTQAQAKIEESEQVKCFLLSEDERAKVEHDKRMEVLNKTIDFLQGKMRSKPMIFVLSVHTCTVNYN